MGEIVKAGDSAWSTSGAAKVLTTSYVAGDEFKSRDADEMWLSLVTAGTVLTTLDLSIRWSDDDGTTYHELPAINSGIASGAIGVSDHEINHDGAAANGNHSFGPVAIPSGCKICVYAKRNGGSTDSTLLAKATLLRSS